MNHPASIPKVYFDLIDQVFEIERKLDAIKETNSLGRNVNKLKDLLGDIFSDSFGPGTGLSYHVPLGEPFNETRTDIEASIAGNSTENLVISEVIKPIIHYKDGTHTMIARKGVVVVKSKK